MPKKINVNLYPPQGYRFREADGSVHAGQSWAHLERTVKGYRERNGIPVGDVKSDIANQFCAEVPGHCRDDEPFVAPKNNPSLTFNNRVLSWIGTMLGKKRFGRTVKVDDAAAARRASLCVGCPAQKSLNTSCGSCVSMVKTSRKSILDGESKHQNLNPCELLGEDCALSVHLQQTPVVREDLPPHCWRRWP